MRGFTAIISCALALDCLRTPLARSRIFRLRMRFTTLAEPQGLFSSVCRARGSDKNNCDRIACRKGHLKASSGRVSGVSLDSGSWIMPRGYCDDCACAASPRRHIGFGLGETRESKLLTRAYPASYQRWRDHQPRTRQRQRAGPTPHQSFCISCPQIASTWV
jgi:hypothetical protein